MPETHTRLLKADPKKFGISDLANELIIEILKNADDRMLWSVAQTSMEFLWYVAGKFAEGDSEIAKKTSAFFSRRAITTMGKQPNSLSIFFSRI